jgi:hypothetical protein
MTTSATLATTPPVLRETPAAPACPSRSTAEIVAERGAAMQAMDGAIRTLLRRYLTTAALPTMLPPVLELTAYDTVYAATPAAGGHWTAATRRSLMFGLQVESITATLEFDEEQRPSRFRVSGAVDLLTNDASPEALERALAQTRRSGLRVGWAPAVVPGLSL